MREPARHHTRGLVSMQVFTGMEAAEVNRYLLISAGLIILGLAAYAIMEPDRVRRFFTGRQARYGSNALIMTIAFLGSLAGAEASDDSVSLETRDWPENWVADTSTPGATLVPPAAVEIRLQLADWGEMRRLYALPPL